MRRDKLVQLRTSRGWFQKDVVGKLDGVYGIRITESYYGMIEQGVRTPKLELALAIANLFDTTPGEVFFDQKPNKMLGDKNSA